MVGQLDHFGHVGHDNQFTPEIPFCLSSLVRIVGHDQHLWKLCWKWDNRTKTKQKRTMPKWLSLSHFSKKICSNGSLVPNFPQFLFGYRMVVSPLTDHLLSGRPCRIDFRRMKFSLAFSSQKKKDRRHSNRLLMSLLASSSLPHHPNLKISCFWH